MKKNWLAVLLLMFSVQNVAAEPPYNAIWQKANRAFQVKQYDSAVFYYEMLAARNLSNPELYYNLGNAYYKDNKIGPAVLNYERAIQLNPDYGEAKDNLSLTQARISNRIQESQDIFFVKWWKSLTKPGLSVTWSVISLILFLITLLVLVLKRWWNKTPDWLQPQVTLLFSVLFLITLFLAYISSQKQVRHDEAVVMAPDTPFRQDLKSTAKQSLVPEGTVVLLEAEDAEWMEVTLPDGRTGWMPKQALEKI